MFNNCSKGPHEQLVNLRILFTADRLNFFDLISYFVDLRDHPPLVGQ